MGRPVSMAGVVGSPLVAIASTVLVAGSTPAAAQISAFTDEAVARGVSYQLMDWPPPAGYLGWGCGFADLDGDGDQDLIVLGRLDGQVGIFENTGSGFFVNRSATSGIPALPQASAFAVGDYDGDGLLDIDFTQLAAGNTLMRGVAPFVFVNATVAAGVGDTGAGKGCAWTDFNNDGWLDLHICNYDGIVPGTAGKPDRLYRNNGNGTFTDVAPAMGVNANGYGFQSVWADIDNDGDPDMYLSQDRGHLPPLMQGNRLWRNDNGTMVEISAGSGADVKLFSMGLAAGDFDGNGFVDFYTANIGSPVPPMNGKNPLLLNQGNNTFVESSVLWGVQHLKTSWAAIFFDFDNNGWLDIFVANQFLANTLYSNSGTPPCTDVSALAGVQGPVGPTSGPYASFCAAVGDVDNDGDLDLVVANLGANVQLLINHEGEKRNWVKYRIVGVRHDASAAGARVNSRIGSAWKLREVYLGGNGYLGQNELPVHVGLGSATMVDEAVVSWPWAGAGGGPTRTLTNVPANHVWTIYPPSRLGDYNGDGVVDIVDFHALGSCFGSPMLPGFEMMDFDGNSVVDLADANAFTGVYSGPIEDCDHDGVVDLIEILIDASLDADGDGRLDHCGGPVGDLDGNGTVDGADLGIMLGNWGVTSGGAGAGDLDGNGVVDGADLGILLGAWE
ncbi:MAG: FG-GAP-like repeat-containing protein [Phycisphaerales bacterium]